MSFSPCFHTLLPVLSGLEQAEFLCLVWFEMHWQFWPSLPTHLSVVLEASLPSSLFHTRA